MEQMLKDFLELTAIPVQSRQERQIADCLKKKLRDLGLTVVEEPIAVADGTTGNIRAVLEGTCDAEPILFSAHMDRVKNNEAISPYLEEESQILRQMVQHAAVLANAPVFIHCDDKFHNCPPF